MNAANHKVVALVLALVATCHWTVLGWLQEHTGVGTALAPMPAPVWMRVIEPSAPAAPLARNHTAGSAATVSGAGPAPAERVPESALPPESPTVPDPAPPPTAPPEIPPPPEPAGAEESGAPSGGWPADTRLSYALKGYYRGDMYGSGQVQWQQSQGRYQVEIKLRMALVVAVTMVSQGDAADDGLHPRVYEEQFPGSVRRLKFDGVAVTFSDGTAVRQPDSVQDTASQFVELTHRFATGRQLLAVGAEVPLWLARPTALHGWTYDVVALETLELPRYGPVAAFHLRPRPVANPSGPITAEIWFAPTLQYLPARIKISLGDGNHIDLLVDRIEQGEP